MSAIAGVAAGAALFARSPFERMDTDQDGSVTKAEFVAGRPRGVSESDSAALYDTIDSDATGALTEDQLKAGMEANRPARPLQQGGGMSEGLLGALFAFQEGGPHNAPPSPGEMYDSMDADGDGSVTRAEFVAGRPEDVSEEDATAFYDSIDTEGTGSITRDQFSAARPPGGPHGPPPSGETGATTATDDETSEANGTSASDLVATLLSAIKAYASSNNIDTAQLSDLLANA